MDGPTAEESASSRGRTFGVVSIALGVIGLVVAFVEPSLALVCGLVGVYLGLLARRVPSARGWALVGLIVNAAVLVLFTAIAATLFP